MPAPDWITVPLPDIALETVMVSLRLKDRVPLSVMALEVESEPSIKPDPIC